MKPNIPLIRKTLEHIESHPEEWYQGNWAINTYSPASCGTAYCFAGWALVLAGHDFGPSDNLWLFELDGRMVSNSEVGVAAKNALGLTQHEANRLFYAHNSLQSLRDIVEDIVGEKL